VVDIRQQSSFSIVPMMLSLNGTKDV